MARAWARARRCGAVLGALACMALATCVSTDAVMVDVARGVVIRDVTIVDTRNGSLATNRAVVIDAGRIVALHPNAVVRAAAAVQVVDGRGQYLVPGFNDMHTHALGSADQAPSYWPLMLANGITGVREMSGSEALIKRAQKLNADSAAGVVDAPEVLQIPGDLVGRPLPPAAATALVQQQKAQGASFIKVVNTNREGLLAVLGEAKAQGLGVAGHLVPGLSAVESSNAGWRAIEHLGAGLGILLDCAGEEAAIRAAVMGGQGARPPFPPTFVLSPMLYRALDAPFYQRTLASYSADKCEAVAQVLAKNDTWQVPTLLRLRTMLNSADAATRSDANLKYVDKTTRALWENLAVQYTVTVPAAAAATFSHHYTAQRDMLKLLKRQGVKLLAGSDVGGIWVIPGFSLQQEFRELAAAGLTPLEVLQSTTLNAAQFLGRGASMGTVEVGKNADLVLLQANPLADVANLEKISGVFLHGRYLPRAALEQGKADVAAALERMPLRGLSSAVDAAHRH